MLRQQPHSLSVRRAKSNHCLPHCRPRAQGPDTGTVETQGSDYALNIRCSNVGQTGNVHVMGMDCRKARNISPRASRPKVFTAMTLASGRWFIGCRTGQAGYGGGNAILEAWSTCTSMLVRNN